MDGITPARSAFVDNAGFLACLGELGLEADEQVASALGVTGQTVRAWAARPNEPVAGWMPPALAGYRAWRAGPMSGFLPVFPRLGFGWFVGWSSLRGLDTYERMGRPFGVGRQAVGKWAARGIPGWLPLACLGVEAECPFRRVEAISSGIIEI